MVLRWHHAHLHRCVCAGVCVCVWLRACVRACVCVWVCGGGVGEWVNGYGVCMCGWVEGECVGITPTLYEG